MINYLKVGSSLDAFVKVANVCLVLYYHMVSYKAIFFIENIKKVVDS